MKNTLKSIFGWGMFFAFALVVGGIHNALSTGVSGVPTNPVFGTVTATSANIGIGTTTPVFTGLSGTAVSAAKIYAFSVNSAGACALQTGISFPSGWSVAHPSTGVCTFTHPSVSKAALMFVVANSVAAAPNMCNASQSSVTTFQVSCWNTTFTATDVQFDVIAMDWN